MDRTSVRGGRRSDRKSPHCPQTRQKLERDVDQPNTKAPKIRAPAKPLHHHRTDALTDIRLGIFLPRLSAPQLVPVVPK
jgi:hypothetical protein